MILCIIAACIVLLYAFVLLIFSVTFGKRYEEDKNLYYKTSDDYPDLQREDISFPSGNNMLHGSLYKTDDNYKDLVIFCHGLGAGHHSYLTEIHAIAKAGHLVLSYDNTGCVASEGKKIRSFYQAVKDVNNAIGYVMSRDDLKDLPIKTAGHSWGGYTAIHALENKHVQKAAVFAPLNNPAKTFAIQVAEAVKIPAALLEPFIRLQLQLSDGKNGL
ncbi:MAG: alpha/beta fold hydrolase, partial [Erysipelotrichaceae bacterium]|nr:alpha/beta fold hydrolase [Erysipelotrichaceae bacterium]